MIITLQFKTPDILDQIDDASLNSLTNKEIEWIKKYIEYEESIIVDFNTETKIVTCRIVK